MNMSNQQLLSDIFSGVDLNDINRINGKSDYNNKEYNTNYVGIEEQPNYLKNTFSSSLPSTSYEEVDRIRNSFRTGNYITNLIIKIIIIINFLI